MREPTSLAFPSLHSLPVGPEGSFPSPDIPAGVAAVDGMVMLFMELGRLYSRLTPGVVRDINLVQPLILQLGNPFGNPFIRACPAPQGFPENRPLPGQLVSNFLSIGCLCPLNFSSEEYAVRFPPLIQFTILFETLIIEQ